jgi:glycosyltransferase involved in cell wall biosynthesis
MKILMLSSYLPYPLFSGGQVRLFNIIRELSARHEITLICEKRPNQTYEDIRRVESICKRVITVDRRKQWSGENILKTGLSGHSFLFTGHTNTDLEKAVSMQLQKESFDLIHVETYYVYQNIEKQNSLPVVLVEHNIEYAVYARYKERCPVFLRPLLSLDIKKIRKEEESAWQKVNRLAVVSHEDKNTAQYIVPDPAVVPNGVNTDQFVFKNIMTALAESEKRILFIGDFRWIQNRDAAAWIIKEIWPALTDILKNRGLGPCRLWVVARQIPDQIRGLSTDPSVLFDEDNSSLPTEEIFQKSYILLAPIRVGGGTSYKILEAMSSGTPVVTTPLSANAINARNGLDILSGDTSGQLANITAGLLSDERLYRKIAVNGRVLIEKNYTWKQIAKKMEDVYKSVL